jgi:hypothetical protein
MAKGTLHMLLSLLILINGMGYTVIQADFLIYQKNIAELFCINKKQPELACEGKCELGRRLSQAQEHEQEQSTLIQEEFSPMIFKVRERPDVLSPWVLIGRIVILDVQKCNGKLISLDFFHPPQT